MRLGLFDHLEFVPGQPLDQQYEERINFELSYQFAFKKFNNFYIRQKIAAFDMDHTLVKPKNNRKFPKDENDWEWYNESVVGLLGSFNIQKKSDNIDTSIVSELFITFTYYYVKNNFSN